MYIFFGDDSVRRGKREGMGMLVSFGGILLPEENLRPLQTAVRAVKGRFGIPATEELKWSPARDSWIYSNLHGQARTDCYRDIIVAAKDASATAIVVCYDRGRRSCSQQEALRKCIDWSFERITMCLEDRHSLGLMICDRPGGDKRDEEALLAEVLSTIQSGTDFVPPSQVPLNILTTPLTLWWSYRSLT